jgi:hypothetical protein
MFIQDPSSPLPQGRSDEAGWSDWSLTLARILLSQNCPDMICFGTKKEPERYYLLAGMGGLPTRRKNRLQLTGALAVGLIVSVAIAALQYWLYTRGISPGFR